MEKKQTICFPEGFFSQSRPKISVKEALKDVTPLKWSKKVLNGNKKAIVNSSKYNKNKE